MVNNISLKKIYHKIRKIIIYIVAGVNGIRKNSVLGRILRFMGYNYINWDVISRMNNDFENAEWFIKSYVTEFRKYLTCCRREHFENIIAS